MVPTLAVPRTIAVGVCAGWPTISGPCGVFEQVRSAGASGPTGYHSAMTTLLGLRTVIYPTEDLAASTAWWTTFLGVDPYFNEEFYVGFDVAGYELGLIPSEEGGDAHTYWGVEDVRAAIDHALEEGASLEEDANDVGEGIVVGAVITPDGSYVGFIENPNFGNATFDEE